MKFLTATLALGLLASTAFAGQTTIFQENNLEFVGQDSNDLITKYASGVAALSDKESIGVGCTSFRIGKDKMMTNFHCLSLIHKDFKVLTQEGIFLGSVSNYLFNFLSKNFKKEPLRTQIIEAIGYLPDSLPANNDELVDFINTFPDSFGYVNFNKTKDNTDDLSETSYKIHSVDIVNEYYDYVVMTVKGLPRSQRINTLTGKKAYNFMKLATIGHPAYDWMDGFKVYDATAACAVKDASLGERSERKENIGHGCDTTGGSSGSPIFERNTGNIIALHWAGFSEDKMNKAIPMKSIIKDISNRKPKLLKKIKIQSK